jgi:putative transposase
VAATLSAVLQHCATPEAISVDNGTEFVSKAMGRVGVADGVRLDFLRPGRPVENAFIESFNGRLRDECLNSHVFGNVAEAQALLDAWRDDYNRVRPHSVLQDRTPEEWAQYLTESRETRDSVSITEDRVQPEIPGCSVTFPA